MSTTLSYTAYTDTSELKRWLHIWERTCILRSLRAPVALRTWTFQRHSPIVESGATIFQYSSGRKDCKRNSSKLCDTQGLVPFVCCGCVWYTLRGQRPSSAILPPSKCLARIPARIRSRTSSQLRSLTFDVRLRLEEQGISFPAQRKTRAPWPS